jgi:exonuclease VII large subunit
MSNDSLIERTLTICRRYEAGEINLESLVSGVELNIGALEGLVESQRQHLQTLATSLELAQFEHEGEDRIRKADSLVAELKESLQSILNAGTAA